MGASRKLQGEIDRVLKKVQEGVDVFDSIWNKVYDTDNLNQKEKFEADLKKEIKKLQRYRDQIKTWIQSSEIKDKKVSASYEQSLVDARKLIEREMERFKICEKETKTKAFSKEGLGQQPKTDPKEKAKAETRDWLNNVVSELESQIDSFEAELEGLSVKKGKTRPPRLTHLETSITRHRAHIIKLELILRRLDNDELSPDQVNDVKDFLDDYVERNQDDFDEFSDVDELYNTLPLDKVEGLEDLVIAGPLVKGTPLSMKNTLAASASQVHSTNSSVPHPSTSQDKMEDTTSQDSSSEVVVKTPPPKSGTSLLSTALASAGGRTTSNVPVPSISNSTQTAAESMGNSSSVTAKEEDAATLPARRPPSSSMADAPLRGIGRGGPSTQAQTSLPSPSSVNGARSVAASASEVTKRNIMGVDGPIQPLTSPLSKIALPQTAKANDGTVSDSNPGDAAASIGRAFSPSIVSDVPWRPGGSFQSQNEMILGRAEIAPDQREKFLQRFQQVQQGNGNFLGLPSLSGGTEKLFSSQQQNPLLQQSSSMSPHGGLGISVQAPGFNVVGHATLQQQSNAMSQQSSQPLSVTDIDRSRNDEQQQQNLPDDVNGNEDYAKVPFDHHAGMMSSSAADSTQVVARDDPDFSPGLPVQPSQPSSSLGVIGRRSVADLGAIGDNTGGSAVHNDQMHHLQLLEAAYYRLPQPKDSDPPRHYSPRNPALTPASYPQVQAPIINNPLLWERFGSDAYGIDTLFFTFYYQQNTYQQYLAAKELKKQAWRFHRKYNTWFQRHEEPKIATDEYEQGTYVYFDFHSSKDESQQGWCQRIKHEFAFEYCYLEDELSV
ncbi:PREDICTED: general negative regulator of transcription subunit 3 isoform X2 [Tarenaya hassleriana]|uniref:general negative regulator of transcription subunit 3 isoform X2 n=1 Tax=Tarenaya hassleriana TaxID=28532 RepID=UPI00053C73DB|nr:PREDICTED: general negative regulator of transcription subunit 3 isoform X2 [Tarenaya hassleriana]